MHLPHRHHANKKPSTTYSIYTGHPLSNGRQSSREATKSTTEATNGNYPTIEFSNCFTKQASQKSIFTK